MGLFSWIKKKLNGKDDIPQVGTLGEVHENPFYEPDTEHTGYNPMFEGGYTGPELDEESDFSLPTSTGSSKVGQDVTEDEDVSKAEETSDAGELSDKIADDDIKMIDGRAVNHYENILQMLNETKKNSLLGGDKDHFTALKTSLSDIIGMLDNSITAANYNDEFMKMSTVYGAALTKFTEYVDTHKKPRTSGGKARTALASTMLGLIKKDFSALADAGASINADTNTTWLEIINRARMEHVQINTGEYTQKGNEGRERYMFQHNGKTKFFTEKIGEYTGGQAAEIASKDCAPQYAELFTRLVGSIAETSTKKNGIVAYFNEHPEVTEHVDNEKICKAAVEKIMCKEWVNNSDFDGNISDALEQIQRQLNKEHPKAHLNVDTEDGEFCKAFCAFGRDLAKVYNKGQDAVGVFSGGAGKNISMRNVAMSRMADLLGASTLLARSVNATMSLDGGEEMVGNLMDGAIGMDNEDVNGNSKKGKEAKDRSAMDFSSPHLQMQSIQLQLLDIVCAQKDRHCGNMFYDFDIDQATGKLTKLKGIQGIDNDAAFGIETELDANKGLGRTEKTKISRDKEGNATDFSLPLVDETMAERILALNKEMITMVLCDLIPQDDIDNTWIRITKLQEYLKELKDYRRPDGLSTFVKPGGWNDATADVLLHGSESTKEEYTYEDLKDMKTGETQRFRKTYYGRILQNFGQISCPNSWQML